MRSIGYSILTAALCILPSSVAWSQSASAIYRIEEDWEVVMGQPDPQIDAPQISTTMSPLGNLNGYHFAFDLNHASHPNFVSGGFQTRVLNGDSVVSARASETRAKLLHEGEVIRWTQVLTVWNGYLIFGVINGQSSSLGAFGGDNTIVYVGNSSLEHLNAYSPNVSKEWSGVGYASNRVSQLQLLRNRLFHINGDVTSVTLNLLIE